MKITGEYNHFGYTIFCGEKLQYTTGNHSKDSWQMVKLNHPNCLPLNKIRCMCIKTGKEIAKEINGNLIEWSGVERVLDEFN